MNEVATSTKQVCVGPIVYNCERYAMSNNTLQSHFFTCLNNEKCYKPAWFFCYSRFFAPVSTRVVCNTVFDRLMTLLAPLKKKLYQCETYTAFQLAPFSPTIN